jgi:protein required for attachment to host cells
MMRVPHNGFVMVADGEKMLFFRNEGDSEYPKLVVERKREQEAPYDRQLKSDAPGRAFSSVSSGRSAMEEADFHQIEEDRFAAATAEMLEHRALRNDFEALVVVAPPRTLGALRKHYHKEVEKRLVGEVAKDLTNVPVEEIERILQAQ